MNEFKLIDQYCRDLGRRQTGTLLGVGDDAALLQIDAGQQLVVSVDTMVEGVHFSTGLAPRLLAEKLLAVNLSDLAAMGAEPRWATLAATLPKADEHWLAEFSSGLNDAATRHNVELVGGDTTQGPLTLSLQIMGVVPAGAALLRSGAQAGDDVWVSGELGDAALALRCQADTDLASQLNVKRISRKLHCPQPQLSLGLALRGLASACIDISDGLLGDLGHLCQASGVGMDVELHQLSLSADYRRYMELGGSFDLAVCGGDDYQLAFTVAAQHRSKVETLAASVGITLSRIGTVTEGIDVKLYTNGAPYEPQESSAYQHFNELS
ncbi:MAG: thiamine-phosphate kinase [Gammaproteobacteria bacterium]|nr:thiamine-phosphate kinase [Gammaproteobacteria bacterium]